MKELEISKRKKGLVTSAEEDVLQNEFAQKVDTFCNLVDNLHLKLKKKSDCSYGSIFFMVFELALISTLTLFSLS